MHATAPFGKAEASLWNSIRTWQPASHCANASSLLGGSIKGQSW